MTEWPRFTALDLSLTSTGYAIGGRRDPREKVGTVQPNGERGMERLDTIRAAVIDVTAGADLAILEGYSFGSRGRAVFSIGELGGVIRLVLHDLGIPFVEVSPGTLKKYATGKGNAAKETVLVEAVKRLEYQGSSDDESDALWLLEMALDHYGVVKSQVPKKHREALESVDWPRLT